MVGRITVAAIGAAGVVVAGLSVASATLWRPDDVMRASVTTGSPYVVTAAGVVEMGGEPTTITVETADGKKAPLTVAVGRDTDVIGWVGDEPHATISGMSGSALRMVNPGAEETAKPSGDPAEDEPAEAGTVEGEPVEGEPTQDEAPAEYQSPAGSDMWLTEASGEGRAELKNWAADPLYPGRWSVLAANPTQAQMTVELAWQRNVSTPWLIPGLVCGGLLVGAAAYFELRRRGILTFERKSDSDTDTDSGNDVDSPQPRSRREARAAQSGGRSGPVPVVSGRSAPAWGTAASSASDDGATEVAKATADQGTAVLSAPADAAPDTPDVDQDPSRKRALPAWTPARTWQRARHSTGPDTSETATRGGATGATPTVAPSTLIQPPPAAPERPRTPAWSRAVSPPTAATPAAPDPTPASTAIPAPSSTPATTSGRRRAWPAPRSAPSPEAEPAPAEPGPARRSGPFGRGVRPGSSSSPTLGAAQSSPAPQPSPAPQNGWLPGRGGRTGAVPQTPAPAEQTGSGRRPAWLVRSPATGPVPAAPPSTAPQGTAPRLSAGPQSNGQPSDPARGDAWRRIWGISTDDGSQEDR